MSTPTDNLLPPALAALPPEQVAWLQEAVRNQQAQAQSLTQLAASPDAGRLRPRARGVAVAR